MSYDLSIRSDLRFTASQSRKVLQERIGSLLTVVSCTGDRMVCTDDAGGLRLEIDLELVSDEGDAVGPSHDDLRNCVRVHVAAAFAEGMEPTIREMSRRLAEAIGWRAFDEQSGEWLEER